MFEIAFKLYFEEQIFQIKLLEIDKKFNFKYLNIIRNETIH